MDMVEKARVFATAAHAAVKQTRKYTNEPYIVHPTEVAAIVASRTDDEFMIAAAYLHDVVEDTGVDILTIWNEFGSIVASYVQWLTDVSKPENGNRAHRKMLDREHMRNAPVEAKTIKLADLIDNSATIIAHGKDFAKIYLKEKRLLLEVLKEGDAVLWERAEGILKQQELK